jgi:hypothetical protein
MLPIQLRNSIAKFDHRLARLGHADNHPDMLDQQIRTLPTGACIRQAKGFSSRP